MNIIRHTNIFLGIGVAVMVLSVFVIAVFGLKFGIDFTGGSLTEVAYDERPEKAAVEASLNELALGGYSLRESTEVTERPGYILRTRDLTETERQAVETVLTSDYAGASITRFTSIGPVIGQELKDKAVWAIAAVVIVIILYVAFAFAGVGRPVRSWAYGFATIIALVHDVLVPTAVMALLGTFAGVEIDVLFIMALLAVLGYSVNDTIVVFDRVRENLVKYRQEKKVKVKNELGQPVEEIEYVFTKPFSAIVAESIDESMLRSINTSLTTGLALVALYIFGGVVTETFALILLAGVLAGTYSSIFFASPLLLWWSQRNTTKTEAVNS